MEAARGAETPAAHETPASRTAGFLANGISGVCAALIAGVLVRLNWHNGLESGVGWPMAVWRSGYYKIASNGWSSSPSPPIWLGYAFVDLVIGIGVVASTAVVCAWILRRGMPGCRQVPPTLRLAALGALATVLLRWCLYPFAVIAFFGLGPTFK
jgi:hypothetical protein